MIVVRNYETGHFAEVVGLWNTVFPDPAPWNDPARIIADKLLVQRELFLIAADDGAVVGTAMAGYDGHRGWLYTIAVDPARQRQGIGSKLLVEAEARLVAMGCGKVNLQVRADNAGVAAFYRAHGFAVEERVSMGKRLPG